MNRSLKTLEEISSQMRLLLLISLLILVIYLLVKKRIDKISFKMFLPTTNKIALIRQQVIRPDIEYSVTLEFYKPFSFFCNCKILLDMKKLPYSRSVSYKSKSAPIKNLSSSYVLKNYPYSDLQAHKKYLSNSKKLNKQKDDTDNNKNSTEPDDLEPSLMSKILSKLVYMVLYFPKKIIKIWNCLCMFIDQFSIERIKEYRLRKKFPLFLDFYIPCRVKNIRLNGVILPPVVYNGRIYIDDRFLKLGLNEIRIQYYSKINMLPIGLKQDPQRLIWQPKGIGLASLFPSFDQSLFNITFSCHSKSSIFSNFSSQKIQF